MGAMKAMGISREKLAEFHDHHVVLAETYGELDCVVCSAYQWGRTDMKRQMRHQLKTANRHLRYAQETLAAQTKLHMEASVAYRRIHPLGLAKGTYEKTL